MLKHALGRLGEHLIALMCFALCFSEVAATPYFVHVRTVMIWNGHMVATGTGKLSFAGWRCYFGA